MIYIAALVAGMIITIALLSLPVAFIRYVPVDVFYTWGDQSAPRKLPRSEEGVPALFGGLASFDPINALATNRTKANMNPPTTVPYITKAGT